MRKCRVCLESSDELISLQSDSVVSLSILHMLSEFTIKNAEQQLLKYICKACSINLDIAYEFKRKYEDSTVKFIRQISFRNVTSSSGENNRETNHNHLGQHREQEQPVNPPQVQQLCEASNSEMDLDHQEMESESRPGWTSLENEQPADVSLNTDLLHNEMNMSTDEDMSVSNSTNKKRSRNDCDLNENKRENWPNVPQGPSLMRIHDVKSLHQTSLAQSNSDQYRHIQEIKFSSNSSRHESQRPAIVELSNSDRFNDETRIANEAATQSRLTRQPNEQQSEVANGANGNQDSVDSSARLAKNENDGHCQEIPHAELAPDANPNKKENRPIVRISENSSNAQHEDEDEDEDEDQEQLPKKSNWLQLSEGNTLESSPLSLNCNQQNEIFQVELVNERKLNSNKGKQRKIVWSTNENEKGKNMTNKILQQIYTYHHRPNKPFRCDVCYRWFKTKGHVKTHRILHIEAERQIKCIICSLSFLTRSHYRNHQCL